MTQEEFNYQTERLCNLYDKKLNAEQLDFWFKSLENTDIASYRRAVGEYAKKNKYMPTISDILTEIKNLKPREEVKRESVECKVCKGTGIAIYKKVIDGREYEYACQCNCKNAIGLDYDGSKCKDERNRSNYYLAKVQEVFGVSR